MGLFDIGIREELYSKKSKEEILNTIQDSVKDFSKEDVDFEKGKLLLEGFKASILKYNLSIDLEKSNSKYILTIDGELQQFYVLIFLALIILSILFTYGIGVILIIAFAFLQKRSSTKFINSLIKDISF